MATRRRSPARAIEARERLLAATLRCALRDGGGALSLQSIAAEANVSKALVLYHYRDKEALLATTIGWLSDRCVARETAALEASTSVTVLEDYWRWLEEELRTGEVRVLLELAQERGNESRQAIVASARQRHDAGERTVSRIFSLLGLAPRVSPALLANCELAFREGLTIGSSQRPEENGRVAFDVFWLSLLSLAH